MSAPPSSDPIVASAGGHDRELTVVIVNYRTPDLTLDALQSLAGEIDPEQHAAVVVDNASGDGSAERIESGIAERGWTWARVVRSASNGGFSAGNNAGMDAARARFYLLLNSDAYVRPGALAELLAAARAHPEAGIVAPRLEWPDGRAQISCFRYRSPASELIESAGTGLVTRLLARWDVPLHDQQDVARPDWTSFACVLLREELRQAIGGMDEGYFMYFDDIDHCRRARRAGFEVLYWPRARVVHLRGGTSPLKQASAARERLPAYYYASRSRYFAKFYGRTGLLAANLLWLIGRAISWSRELVGSKSAHVCEGASRDIWHAWSRPLDPGSGRPAGGRA